MAEGVAVVDQEADPLGVKLNLSMESIWCMIVFVRIISVNKLKPITLLNSLEHWTWGYDAIIFRL